MMMIIIIIIIINNTCRDSVWHGIVVQGCIFCPLRCSGLQSVGESDGRMARQGRRRATE